MRISWLKALQLKGSFMLSICTAKILICAAFSVKALHFDCTVDLKNTRDVCITLHRSRSRRVSSSQSFPQKCVRCVCPLEDDGLWGHCVWRQLQLPGVGGGQGWGLLHRWCKVVFPRGATVWWIRVSVFAVCLAFWSRCGHISVLYGSGCSLWHRIAGRVSAPSAPSSLHGETHKLQLTWCCCCSQAGFLCEHTTRCVCSLSAASD